MHIITSNEYLARRDYKEVGKILEYMGVSVGLIYQNMDIEERKREYLKDVTYGTNMEFGFDYLRDNTATNKGTVVQRELYYAIVDEADSILLDEAQTPMIISQKKEKIDEIEYIKARDFVQELKGISIIKEEPKNKKQLLENEKYDYVVDKTYKTVTLTQKGIDKAESEYGIENYFTSDNINIMNHINQALLAKEIFKKDIDYIIEDEKILIVDTYTGRVMKGKRYTKGLHEAIEAKENIKIKNSSELKASITIQNYFKMYKKISGMTGTAKTSEKEFKEVYGLNVVEVPTNKKSQRIDKKDKIYGTIDEKYKGMLEEIKQSQEKGQPVLIGTTSIENTVKISNLLEEEHIKHNVLNAKNDEEEAKIVENAGNLNEVTIATNMAGRGTNIILGTKTNKNEVLKAGGLKVIGTEKHETKRIDEQLRGRSARQGEKGESIFYLSLEDEIMQIYGNTKKAKRESHNRQLHEYEKAQKRAENRNYTFRKYLLKYDEILNYQRNIIYENRKKILDNEFENIIENLINEFVKYLINENQDIVVNLKSQIESIENIKFSLENQKEISKKIYDRYKEKKKTIGKEEFEKQEKSRILEVIDKNWIEHLENMEYIKDTVQIRAYGGYKPLEEYAKQGKEQFDELIEIIKINSISQLLFNINIL